MARQSPSRFGTRKLRLLLILLAATNLRFFLTYDFFFGCDNVVEDALTPEVPRVIVTPGKVFFTDGEIGPVEASFPRLATWTIEQKTEGLEWFFTSGQSDTKSVTVGVARTPTEAALRKDTLEGSARICAQAPEEEKPACGSSRAQARATLQPSDFPRSLTKDRPLETAVTLHNPDGEAWDFEIVEVPPFVKVELVDWNNSIADLLVELDEENQPECPVEKLPCDFRAEIRYRVRHADGRTVTRIAEYIVWVN